MQFFWPFWIFPLMMLFFIWRTVMSGETDDQRAARSQANEQARAKWDARADRLRIPSYILTGVIGLVALYLLYLADLAQMMDQIVALIMGVVLAAMWAGLALGYRVNTRRLQSATSLVQARRRRQEAVGFWIFGVLLVGLTFVVWGIPFQGLLGANLVTLIDLVIVGFLVYFIVLIVQDLSRRQAA